MQMGVLRLGVVGIQLRETHVGNLAPFSCAGLDISVIDNIERVLFDTLKELDGIVESFLVASGTHIFAQAVDHESYGIKLLFGVLGIALAVERPVGAAIFAVDEMGNDIVLGSRCHFEILAFAEHTVCSREGP